MYAGPLSEPTPPPKNERKKCQKLGGRREHGFPLPYGWSCPDTWPDRTELIKPDPSSSSDTWHRGGGWGVCVTHLQVGRCTCWPKYTHCRACMHTHTHIYHTHQVFEGLPSPCSLKWFYDLQDFSLVSAPLPPEKRKTLICRQTISICVWDASQ